MKKEYASPAVETLTTAELLASLGPAQANPSGRSGGDPVSGLTAGSGESGPGGKIGL